ncbi:MAG TPA: lipopolysaccharide kinase InaA family protein [Rhodocyclaceae bacterium]|nr:lipopolysaccharide kinase InaA family protein [Rhodocyclaceae bacterium]
MSDKDFEYWWTVPGQWVEPPNERRNGWSGMMRVREDGRLLYVKRQRNHLCRTLLHPLGWPTASREWFYLNLLRLVGVTAPEPVFHDVRDTPEGKEAVLVTEELAGYADLAAQADLAPSRRRALACELGLRLGVLHRARLQHSSLYDKHIMVRWSGEAPQVALIDLEKMRRRLTRRAAARHDLEQLKRRQRVFDDQDWQTLVEAHAQGMGGAARRAMTSSRTP